MKNILCFLIFFSLLSGCQMLRKSVTGLEPTPEQKMIWRNELQSAWEELEQNHSEVAYKKFQDFQKKYPKTIYEVEARLGEANSLEQMQEWVLAGRIYREITVERMSTHPELASLAFYENSKVAEALGNESEMMANLLDAKKNEALLPNEIRLAGIPARLAVAQIKVGDLVSAKKSLLQAEKGIHLLKQQGVPAKTWAKLYFQMGSVATNQLSPENFQAHLDSFKEGQIFLLKALETGEPPWADRSLAALQSHYQDFWNMAMNPPVSRALDRGAQERSKLEAQQKWLGEIAEIMNFMRNNQRPVEQQSSAQEKKMNEFFADIDKEMESILISNKPFLTLTPESQNRQRLKLLKPQTQALPEKLPAKDPNLNSRGSN